MAQRLGISTATFSKYRSILKLPEELVEAIAQLLDENRINFEAAYRASQLTNYDVEVFLRLIRESEERKPKLDMDKLKKYAAKNIQPGHIQPFGSGRMESVIIPPKLSCFPVFSRSTKQNK